MTVFDLILVALGGGFGAVLRGVAGKLIDTKFPWATFIVNVVGSFLIGFLIELLSVTSFAGSGECLLTKGFCGGFTTFSSFSYQTLDLFSSGKAKSGTANIIISLVSSLLAVGLGIYAGKLIIS